MASLLPTPEPPDPVEGALGHFDHSNWVKASLKALDAGTVHAVGGSSGALTVDSLTVDNSADQDARINLNGNGARSLMGRSSSDFARWQFLLGDGTAEGGSNSGSLFKLHAFADNGALLHTVLHADRTSGLLEVKGSPTTAKGIATKEYVDSSMPIGAIIAYGGSDAPAGWHICNGTAHGSAALQTLIGSANTPDLSNRFILGAGTEMNPGTVGGVASNLLTPAQTATKGHTHAATTNPETQEHTHTVDPPPTWTSGQNQNHSHSVSLDGGTHGHAHYASNLLSAEGDFNPAGSGHQFLIGTGATIGGGGHSHAGQSAGANVDHAHSVNIGAFQSAGRSATHTHVIQVTATADANATAPIENRPPFYALVYIIKKI